MPKDLLKPYVYMVEGARNFSLYDMINGKFYKFSLTGSVKELRKHLFEEGLIFETEGIVPNKIINVNMRNWQTKLLLREFQIRLNGRGEDNCWNREKTKNKKCSLENETLARIISECEYIPIEKIRIEAEQEEGEKIGQIIEMIKCSKLELNIEAIINTDYLKKYEKSCEKKSIELILSKRKDIGKYKLNILNFFYSQYFNPCLGHQISVDTNGDIKPCLWHDDVIGNILKDNLKDLIISGKFDRYWEITKSKIEVCKDCEMRYVCDDCRVFTLKKTGKLYAQSSHCHYDPYTG